MNTPFRLPEQPRRPQPYSPPPPDYFAQLPHRVLARVAPEAAPASWAWLLAWPLPLRTALASGLLLGGFATTLWITTPTPPATAAAALAAVPETELLHYLLANDTRVTLADLADFPVSPPTAATYLHASPEELQNALDAQPADDVYL